MPARGHLTRSALIALVGWAPVDAVRAQDAAVADPTPVSTAPSAEFEATLLRTWSDDDVTMVDGLAQVPLSIMAGGTTGAYRFELTVFDSDDTQLYRDSWERNLTRRAAAYTGSDASTVLEPFRFGVRAGDYEVEMRAYPTDAPDLGKVVRVPVVAFAERPVASDLYLGDRVEALDDDGGGSWSITHGGFGISAVAKTAVVPQHPTLFYYVELYGDAEQDQAAGVSATVIGDEGRRLYTTPETMVEVPVGGLPFAGSLSLAGLPPGDYDLELEVTIDGEVTRRSAPFKMLDPEAAQPVIPESYESRYFAALSDAELEDVFGGVGYLLTESERQAYESLPPDAQRRYLTEFFARRNPTMGAMGNSYLEEYVDRVGTVRLKYGELVGTGERRPWATDAGRIYLKYGEPDERAMNHFPSSSDNVALGSGARGTVGQPPYEIWSYHSTGYVYLFIGEQMGVWRMIFSTDPTVRSLADWADRAGGEALDAMARQFGIQPRF